MLSWEELHKKGLTARQAAEHRGASIKSAHSWASKTGNSFVYEVALKEILPEGLEDPDDSEMEVRSCRALFTAVIIVTLSDFRANILAARQGLRVRYQESRPIRLRSEANEIAAALEYIRSYWFREMCEMAGRDGSPQKCMAWVTGKIDTPPEITGRRYAK